MKKVLIALTLIVVFAATSFASVSFLTASSVGVNKIAVLGMYATNANSEITGNLSKNDTDGKYGRCAKAMNTTSLGIRVEYGVMEDLDVLVAYSADTYVNAKNVLELNQKSGSTTGLGVKYTLNKLLGDLPVDVAAVLGYEYSEAMLGSMGIGQTTYALAGIVSKKIDMFIPYGAMALKSLSQNAMPNIDARPGTGLAINLGCMIGVAANQAVAIEMNSETQSWADTKAKDDAYASSVSGLSIGYVYVF